MSEKQEKVCRSLDHFEYCPIFHFCCQGMCLNFCFCFITVPVDIRSSAIGLKICAITALIEKYKSIIKKKRTKYDKIVLLAKIKLNTF